LSTLLLGANTITQSILDELLNGTNYTKQIIDTCHLNSQFLYERISKINGLKVSYQPNAASAMMVEIDLVKFKGFATDIQFCEKLLEEEAVAVCPGSVLKSNTNSWFRLTYSHKLYDLCDRLQNFCNRYAK